MKAASSFLFLIVNVAVDVRAERDPQWTIQCEGPVPAGTPPGWSIQRLCARSDGLDLSPVRLLSNSLKGYCYARGGEVAPNPTLPPVSFNFPEPPKSDTSKYWRKAQLCRDRCWCKDWNEQWPTRSGISADVKPDGYPRENMVRRAGRGPGGATVATIMDVDGQIETRFEPLEDNQRYTTILQGYQDREEAAVSLVPLPHAIALDNSNLIECSTTLTQRFGISGPLSAFLSRLRNRVSFSQAIADTLGIPPPSSNTKWTTIRQLCATSLAGGNPGANAGAYCSSNLPYTSEGPDIQFSDDWTPRGEWTWKDNWEFALRVRSFCFQSCRCKGQDEKTVMDKHALMLKDGWQMSDKTKVTRMFFEDGTESLSVDSTGNGNGNKLNVKGWFSPRQRSCAPGPNNEPATCPNPDPCILEDYDICTPKPWPVNLLGPAPVVPAERIDATAPTCGAECDSPRSCNAGATRDSNCKCTYLSTELRRQLNLIGSTSLSLSTASSGLAALCLQLDVLKGLRRARLGVLGGRAVGEENRGILEGQEGYSCMCNATYASTGCCESETGMLWEDDGVALRL